MGSKIFNKIEAELSNENPNLDIISDELRRIKDEYIYMESEVEDLEYQVDDLESEVDDLKEDLEKYNQPDKDHNLDDYFLDKIVQELRQRWRYSSVKLEQKLKESDII